jgi:hypothetical protein
VFDARCRGRRKGIRHRGGSCDRRSADFARGQYEIVLLQCRAPISPGGDTEVRDRRTLIKYGLASVAALETLRAGAQIRVSRGAPGEQPISIEPNPGYQRIGCEAAWTTQAIVDAQVARAESSWATEQPYVASMALGFARNRRFEHPLQFSCQRRVSRRAQVLAAARSRGGARCADLYSPDGPAGEFPDLKICIGHLGEGMPLLMDRFDCMQFLAERPNTRGVAEGTTLKRQISEYMTDNLYVTTSGVAWAPAVKFCQDVLGVDHVLYAMDYPYQRDAYEVAALDTMPISFDHRKKLFQTNEERLFHL